MDIPSHNLVCNFHLKFLVVKRKYFDQWFITITKFVEYKGFDNVNKITEFEVVVHLWTSLKVVIT